MLIINIEIFCLNFDFTLETQHDNKAENIMM